MAVDLVQEVWQELKRYIGPSDRSDAADTLINLLIDHDYDAEQIRDAFKGDNDIKRSLREYLEEDAEMDDDDPYDDDDY